MSEVHLLNQNDATHKGANGTFSRPFAVKKTQPFKPGVIEVPFLGEIKQQKSTVIFRVFPDYNNALLGLVI